MFIRNKDREVRLVWCLLLLVIAFLAVAYLLRYIPIRLTTSILVNQGMSSAEALLKAQSQFLEDAAWTSIVGTVQGLFWFPIVLLIIRLVEKRKTTCAEMGFSVENRKLWFLPAGIFLGTLLFFGYFGISSLFEGQKFAWNLPNQSIAVILLITADMLFNGFGEEFAFRAYFQDRLIQRHGLWLGVLIGSISFVILHLLVAPFTWIALVSSIFFAAILGLLFFWSKSIFLVGSMHMAFNLLPRLFDQWPSDLALIIGNSVSLLIVLALFLYTRKSITVKQ